jgi:divalent metal cation (Fe/Co/Zn/Cd) transporter
VVVIRSAHRGHQGIDVKTQHIGPEELLVAGKIEFDHQLTGRDIALSIDQIEKELRATVPLEMRIYLEPNIYDPDSA